MVVVILTALPCHFYLLTGSGPLFTPFGNPEYLKIWLVVGHRCRGGRWRGGHHRSAASRVTSVS